MSVFISAKFTYVRIFMSAKAADVDGFIVDEEGGVVPGELADAHWKSVDVIITVLGAGQSSLWEKINSIFQQIWFGCTTKITDESLSTANIVYVFSLFKAIILHCDFELH